MLSLSLSRIVRSPECLNSRLFLAPTRLCSHLRQAHDSYSNFLGISTWYVVILENKRLVLSSHYLTECDG